MTSSSSSHTHSTISNLPGDCQDTLTYGILRTLHFSLLPPLLNSDWLTSCLCITSALQFTRQLTPNSTRRSLMTNSSNICSIRPHIRPHPRPQEQEEQLRHRPQEEQEYHHHLTTNHLPLLLLLLLAVGMGTLRKPVLLARIRIPSVIVAITFPLVLGCFSHSFSSSLVLFYLFFTLFYSSYHFTSLHHH
jgi:hypothetical protein